MIDLIPEDVEVEPCNRCEGTGWEYLRSEVYKPRGAAPKMQSLVECVWCLQTKWIDWNPAPAEEAVSEDHFR